MAIQDLKEQIARLPEQPGVYIYSNTAGDTIYVGKARAARAKDDVVDAPALRHPLVQRSDHRAARSRVSRIRHQALHRAVCRCDLLAGGLWPRRAADRALSRREERRADQKPEDADDR